MPDETSLSPPGEPVTPIAMRFLLALLSFVVASAFAQTEFKVMTYNLRFASLQQPNAWPDRRPIMKECLLAADPDIIGTQEGLYEQLKDLEKDLPQYRWLGLGREGGSKGEFMAIYYKADRFDPLAYDHFWLSDTPNVIASTTWGNSVRRMVTWMRFKDLKTGREFYLVNTHFDHQVQPAREKSAELLLERIKQLRPELPIILTGDFNAKAGANKAYDILTSGDFLKDTWHTAAQRRGEVVATFTGFREIRREDNRIDWILTRGVSTQWIQIDTCAKNNQFPSDHFPVTAQVKLD
jgi:endonuclease/exonuclease/phosphatase family metal-dependent hydrolase